MAVRLASSRGQIIFGVSAGVFKLNHCSHTHRRGRKPGIIHTGLSKPSTVTAFGPFRVLTSAPLLPAGEFLYEAPGQYLKITNTIDIDLTLVADPGGSNAISTAQVVPNNASNQRVLSTMMQPAE